jgi:hypothetical protein
MGARNASRRTLLTKDDMLRPALGVAASAAMRTTIVTLAALPLLGLRTLDLPPQNLPILGGSGGTAFSRDCGAGRALSGVRYRSGAVIDAIGIQCRPVLADGSLGPESAIGTLAGGGGGTIAVASCPSGTVVTGLRVRFGSYVSYVILTCRAWRSSARTWSTSTPAAVSLGSVLTPASATTDQACEASQQPGSGLRGRAATFLDGVGLVCDEP